MASKIVTGILLALASVSPAASQDDPPPPPEVHQAGQAYMSCLQGHMEQADDSLPARTAAQSIVRSCEPQALRLRETYRAWVEASDMSQADRSAALEATRRSMEGVEEQLVREVEASRSDD